MMLERLGMIREKAAEAQSKPVFSQVGYVWPLVMQLLALLEEIINEVEKGKKNGNKR